MRRLLLIGIPVMILLLTGCSSKFGQNEPAGNLKSFIGEDKMIFQALSLAKAGIYEKSSAVYKELYDQSHKSEYLLEYFKQQYHLKRYKPLLKELQSYLEEAPHNKHLLRYQVAVLSALQEIEEAKKAAFTLLAVTKEPQDYQRVASLYLIQNNYISALKYLESAYAIDKNEDILSDLTTIMYLKLGQKREAISYLESHSRIHGCSVKICQKLASFYGDMDDTLGMISIYKRLYALTKQAEYAQRIIQAYAYNRDNYNLVRFLEESAFNDELLLRLYMAQKVYDKSIGLSQKLYLQTKKPYYQAQYAISLYEGTKKITPRVVGEVIDNLRDVVKAKPDATYLNYLGYLLIDHDVDVKEGIAYVNKALAIETDSGFFLDSLAWGYYKLNQCKKALSTIKKAKNVLDQEYEEVETHYKLIKKCKK